ncbi:tetratricopeptide repeat protein, partial [Cribrihabitans sp. XS_ASV171]
MHRKRPKDAAVLVEIGQARLSRGNPAGAEDAFAGALACDKRNEAAWLGRIDLAAKRGDPVRASVLARQAVELLPGTPKVVARTARALVAIGRLEEARELLEDALERLETADAGIVLAHALVLRGAGDFTRAEDLLDALGKP